MFGHVEFKVKPAPGVGVVSSAVLQSDALDEIDWEWLGGDNSQVQSNYFSKGQVTTYNRGAFHPNPNNQADFHTYTIDWTADQIAWQIDGKTVRTLSPDAAQGQYPQTPMMIKVGAWSGGDAANAPGTIGKFSLCSYNRGQFLICSQHGPVDRRTTLVDPIRWSSSPLQSPTTLQAADTHTPEVVAHGSRFSLKVGRSVGLGARLLDPWKQVLRAQPAQSLRLYPSVARIRRQR